RVGSGHERRVEHLRDLGDDLHADEDGEHEDVQRDEQTFDHGQLPPVVRVGSQAVAPARTCLARACTTSPSWVTRRSRVISSSWSMRMAPSAVRCWSSARTLREYIWLA